MAQEHVPNLDWIAPSHDPWEYTTFRGLPESVVNLESLAVGDIDGDGRTEIVVGGDGALVWYRSHTTESGVISVGHHGVALALEDVDGDGVPEVVVGREKPDESGIWQIVVFKAPRPADEPWEKWVIVPRADGEPHDIDFADLDGDGARELIVDAPYCDNPGTLAYRPGRDRREPWQRHELVMGIMSEAIAVGDLDGDGAAEIVHGPDWYSAPLDGPWKGPWTVRSYARSFREMGRVALFDITGDGRLDIVCSEAEYPDGRLSWFENRLTGDGAGHWIEHRLDTGLYFAHSLSVWRDEDGEVRILVGEMAHGGYRARRNWRSRLIEFRILPEGTTRRIVSTEAGTHEARMADIDDDGELEIVGKNWREPTIQIWRKRPGPAYSSRVTHTMLDRDRPRASRAVLAADIDNDGNTDLVSGSFWYRNPTWEREEIPDVTDVLASLDGATLVVAMPGDRLGLTWCQSDGLWSHEVIGRVSGIEAVETIEIGASNPRGILVATEDSSLLAFRRTANGFWTEASIGTAACTAGITVADLDGDGREDAILGNRWLQNHGDGSFSLHHLEFGIDLTVLSAAVGDVDGDGREEIVLGTASPDVLIHGDEGYAYRQLGRLLVLRREDDCTWSAELIDGVREPRTLWVADIDGDGAPEIICGESDPSWPYRSQARLFVYKPGDPLARTWIRHTIDDRFSHHGRPAVLETKPGVFGVASASSVEPRYLNLWEIGATVDHLDQSSQS